MLSVPMAFGDRYVEQVLHGQTSGQHQQLVGPQSIGVKFSAYESSRFNFESHLYLLSNCMIWENSSLPLILDFFNFKMVIIPHRVIVGIKLNVAIHYTRHLRSLFLFTEWGNADQKKIKIYTIR